MRRLLSASILTLSLAMASSVSAEEWFRLNMSSPIFFDGAGEDGAPPDGGVNNNISVSIPSAINGTLNGRIDGNLDIDVVVGGIDGSYSITVGDLPGASWVPGGTAYGSGSLVWTAAVVGTFHPTIEVRDASGAVVASQALDLTIHPHLVAMMPTETFETAVGENITIAPTVTGLIQPGAVQWGTTPSPLPDWLELNEATGSIQVDATTSNSISNVVLTAVDQTDLNSASTASFSVGVNSSCSPWSARTAPSEGWYGITYGNGQFVAVAAYGTNRVMTSPDGITWTARTAPNSGWYDIAYGNGQFVAIATDGANRVMNSSDGITWTPRAAPEDNLWYGVTYGGGKFVAVAATGASRVMTSLDGVNWNAHAAAEPNYWVSVTYGNGEFVAGSTGANQLMTSSDGTHWTAQTVPSGDWYAIAHGGGRFVAVATSGANQVITSDCD